MVVLCFFLFAFRAGAQTPAYDDPRQYADMAQQYAEDAEAKRQVAQDVYNDAVATLDADVGKGACEAQILDDIYVKNAVDQDYANAQNAAKAAQDYASNAQTYANNDDLASAQQAAADAAAQDTQAQTAATKAQTDNANEGDKIGDPSNTIWANNDPTCNTPTADPTNDDQANQLTDSVVNGLANDPAGQQQQLNNMINLFNSTTTTPTVVPGDSGGSGGGSGGGGGGNRPVWSEEDCDD